MRSNKMITKGNMLWYLNKFSQPFFQEMYWSLEKLYVELRALRVKINSQDYKDKNKHCKEKKYKMEQENGSKT